jgi:hypothetical protein
MKYILLCYDDEQAWQRAGASALHDAMSEAVALTHELHARGQYVRASPLHAASTATCVRVRDGKRIITDGPFAETREVLGGFYLLEVETMEEAIAIAARHPGQRFGGVEVRPVLEVHGLPGAQIGAEAGARQQSP